MLTLSEVASSLGISNDELQTVFSSLGHEGKKISPSLMRQLLERLELEFYPRVMSIAALKGGIGKTFLTTQTAIRSSMYGASVLVIDLDPEACASNTLLSEEQLDSITKATMLEVIDGSVKINDALLSSKYPGLDILPASLRLAKTERLIHGKNPKTLMKKFIDQLDYDLILFDLPPSFSTLSSSAYLASSLVVIPCMPDIYSLESVDLTIEAIREVASEFECRNIEFKILMNKFNPHRTASKETLKILEKEHRNILFPFQIRDSAEIQNSINAGYSIFEGKCSQSSRSGIEQLVKILCSFKVTNVSHDESEGPLFSQAPMG